MVVQLLVFIETVIIVGLVWALLVGQPQAWEVDKTRIRAYQTVEARPTAIPETGIPRKQCPAYISSC